jgi:hypothetical protein
LAVAVLFAAAVVPAYADKGGVKPEPKATKAPKAPNPNKPAPKPTKTPKPSKEPKAPKPQDPPTVVPTSTPEAPSVDATDVVTDTNGGANDANKGRIWVMRCDSNGHNPKTCDGVVAYRSNDPRHAGKTVDWKFEGHGGPNAGSGSDSGSFKLDENGNGSAHFQLTPGMYKLYGKVNGTSGGWKHKVVKCSADEEEDTPDEPVEPPFTPQTPEPPETPPTPEPPDDEPETPDEPTTRRICWHSNGKAVEVWDDLVYFLDESYIIGEANDEFCWDMQVGATNYILTWDAQLGHSGPQYLIHVQEEGETLNIHNPFTGIMLLDGAFAARTN